MDSNPSYGAKPFLRVDGRQKVTGSATYAAEFTAPRMAHAVLVQSPIAKGRISALDTAAAQAAPGALYVLTRRNRPPLQHLPEEYISAFPGERRTPLEDDVIHYAGQHVALVVATTLEEANAAASLLRIEYESEPPVLDPRSSVSARYKPSHFAKNGSEALQSERGSPDAVEAPYRVDLQYLTPVVHHNPIEPSATLAEWQGTRLLLHDSTRWIYGSRKFVSQMLGIGEDSVEVVCPYVGGAFGSKGFIWQHVVLTALAAKLVDRPVRLVLSRPQMFTSVGHRPQTIQDVSLGAESSGRLVLLKHSSLNGTSPVAHFVEPAAMSSRHLYSCPNVRIEHLVAPVNISTPCFMRAPGEAPGMFALESAMDEVALKLEIDPLELRLRNYAEKDEEAGRPWSGKHLRECYDQGAKRFGWFKRNPQPRSHQEGRWLIGTGMATAAYPGRRSQSTVHAELHRDGEAVFSTATHEIGTGTRTAMAQIAAETLGVPRDRIRVEVGDSRLPPSPVHGASQATASVGPAVLRAAGDLRNQLLLLATSVERSPLYGFPVSGLQVRNGFIASEDGDRRIHYSELLQSLDTEKLAVEASAEPGSEKEEFTWNSFGAHFVEVRVHADTHEIRVSRWVGVFDAGRILNPVLARSQFEGAFLFGVGMALMEQTLYDPNSGSPTNPSLSEYLVPTSADVPEMDIHFISSPDLRFNPLGVRGLGELGITGAVAAIANAVFHATGTRVRELPITPAKLIEAGMRKCSHRT